MNAQHIHRKMWPFAFLLHLVINAQFAAGQELPANLRNEFCVDNVSLTVDGYIEKGDRTYEIYFRDSTQNKYQVLAKSEKSEHMPDQITFLGAQGSSYDIYKVNATGSDYRFDDVIKAYAWKNGNEWRLMGFNQIWLGCPQPMCLQPHIDAATQGSTANEIYIFRGKYFWALSGGTMTPRSAAAKTINEFQFADCGIQGGKTVFIFKGSQMFEFTEGKWKGPYAIAANGSDIPENSDAATSTGNYVYFFRGSQMLWRYVMEWKFETYPLEAELHNIEAAVKYPNDTVMLYKGRKYINVRLHNSSQSASMIEKLGDWQFTQNFFVCDYSQTPFKTRQAYEMHIGVYLDGEPMPNISNTKPPLPTGPPVIPESPIPEATTATTTKMTTTITTTITTTTEEDEAGTFLLPLTIIVIIVAVLGIALCCIILYSKKGERKEKAKSKKSQKTVSTARTAEAAPGTVPLRKSDEVRRKESVDKKESLPQNFSWKRGAKRSKRKSKSGGRKARKEKPKKVVDNKHSLPENFTWKPRVKKSKSKSGGSKDKKEAKAALPVPVRSESKTVVAKIDVVEPMEMAEKKTDSPKKIKNKRRKVPRSPGRMDISPVPQITHKPRADKKGRGHSQKASRHPDRAMYDQAPFEWKRQNKRAY